MELPGLAISKRFALGGIASLAERPYSDHGRAGTRPNGQGQSFPAGVLELVLHRSLTELFGTLSNRVSGKPP